MSVILNVGFFGLLTAATAGLASRAASLVASLIIAQFSDEVKSLRPSDLSVMPVL